MWYISSSHCYFDYFLETYSAFQAFPRRINLDYQNIFYNNTNDSLTVHFYYTGDCKLFQFELVERDEVFPNKTQIFITSVKEFTLSYSSDQESVPSKFFRMLAIEGSNFCSDEASSRKFYRFSNRGMMLLFHLYYKTNGYFFKCNY